MEITTIYKETALIKDNLHSETTINISMSNDEFTKILSALWWAGFQNNEVDAKEIYKKLEEAERKSKVKWAK